MKATYDPEAQALYVRVCDLPVKRTLIRTSHNTDFAANGHVVGHEFLLTEPLEVLTSDATANMGPAPIVVSSDA